MLRYISLVFCMLIGGHGGYAQEDMPIVLVAAQGKIAYKSASYSSKQLNVGAVLKPSGTLALKANQRATLFANGVFQTVQGPQKVTLQSLFPDQERVKINFERNFGAYLLAALDLAANPLNPKDNWGTITGKKGGGDGWGTITGKKGGGDGWGTITGKKGGGDGWGTITGKKGGGDGWGGKGKTLHAIRPFGKIRQGATRFQWSKPAGAGTYLLEIKNSKGEVIHKSETSDTSLTVELDAMKYKEGQKYSWSVRTQSGEIQSAPAGFEIGTAQQQSSAVQKAEQAESYAQAVPTLQGMMRAIALEQGEWFMEAAQTYETLQKTDADNPLLRLMHAAFWMRNGPAPIAEQVFKQP